MTIPATATTTPLPGEAVTCPSCGREIGRNRWGGRATHCGLDGFRCPGSGRKAGRDEAA